MTSQSTPKQDGEMLAALAEIDRLRELLAAKPWPPSDAELREMLAVIVGAWWSQSTASEIRKGRLGVTDIKGMYAIRDVLAPYVARAALQSARSA